MPQRTQKSKPARKAARRPVRIKNAIRARRPAPAARARKALRRAAVARRVAGNVMGRAQAARERVARARQKVGKAAARLPVMKGAREIGQEVVCPACGGVTPTGPRWGEHCPDDEE